MTDLISTSGVVATNQANLVFGFLPSPPPPWLGYITALIALGVLAIHVIKFFSEKSSDRKKRLDDINDSFWFRSVVVPAVIEPLIKFVTEQGEKLKTINHGTKDDFANFLKGYSQGGEGIAARLLLLNIVNKQMYEQTIKEFEEIEDDVTMLCAIKSGDFDEIERKKAKHTEVNALVTRMYAGLNTILDNLKRQHHNI